MEYGLQSASNKTLKRINRGHGVDDFVKAVELTKEYGFKVCAHVIFGLPGETYREMEGTVEFLSGQRIDGVKFHQCYVVKGTPLHELYASGLYRPIEQEEYARMVAKAIKALKGVVVQRLTGDPAPGELVAPSWSTQKQKTISLIKSML